MRWVERMLRVYLLRLLRVEIVEGGNSSHDLLPSTISTLNNLNK